MALRNVRELGDPCLRKVCKEVKNINARTKILIDDMLDTMYEANGVGLAAPQVTYVVKALKEKGWDIDTTATTVEEAKEAILLAIKKREKIC